MVRRPANAVAKPLMRHFVRRHFLDEAGKFVVDVTEQHPALGGIGVRGNRQVHQIGPGLPEAEVRLFGNLDVIIGRLAEKERAHLHLSPSLIQHVFGHCTRRHRRQSVGLHGIHASAKRAALKCFQRARHIAQVVTRNGVVRKRVGKIHFGVLAVVEARDRYWHRCHPMGHRIPFFLRFALQFPDTDHHISMGNFERQVVQRFFSEAVQVRVPGSAGGDVVAAVAGFGHHLVTRIFDRDGMLLAERRGFVQYGIE